MDAQELEILYFGAFNYYLNECQFKDRESVEKFCDRLILRWKELPKRTQNYISNQLEIAWEKEQDYGKDNQFLSPFGIHQDIWYNVIDMLLIGAKC